jgi:hypothetical protein
MLKASWGPIIIWIARAFEGVEIAHLQGQALGLNAALNGA